MNRFRLKLAVAALAISWAALAWQPVLAGCLPANQVEEWLTTNRSGVPGLLGYHYRIKQKAFVCKVFSESQSFTTESMVLVYGNLPKGVAMVEYWAKPADLATGDKEPASYTDEDLQTLLFVGAPLNEEAERAVTALLESGKVEFFFSRYDVELPKAVLAHLNKVVFYARIDPGRTPSLLAIDGAVFSPPHLDWARQLFVSSAAEAGR